MATHKQKSLRAKGNKMNEYLTKDIQISTDSVGHMKATHKYQGLLIDGSFYASRKDCRREAVEILKEKKEQGF